MTPFEIVRELGRGAAGAVYEVRLPGDPRRLVAKVLVAPSDHALSRFQREGELLARLRHPGIVSVQGSGVLPDGRPYLLLELVDGETLEALLAREGILSESHVLDIARQLASALAYAHHQGVVHRDLKPANVLIDREGAVRLTDFGVAYVADAQRLTQTGAIVGTPAYMAPEQLGSGEAVGPWTDVYGFGVLLFELLTSELPLEGASAAQSAERLRHSMAADPRGLRPALERHLAALVKRCLAESPARRFQDGRALLEALTGEVEEAPAARAAPWPLAAGLLAVIGVAAGAFALRGSGSEAGAHATKTTETKSEAKTDQVPKPVSLWDRSLSWTFREGEAFRCTLSLADIKGTELASRLTWRARHLVVGEPKRGQFRIEGTIEGAKFEQMTRGVYRLAFDSDKPGEGRPDFAGLASLVGMKYEYVQDGQTGSVPKVQGGDAMAAVLAKQVFPDSMWLRDTAMHGMLNGVWAVTPGRPVKRRERWSVAHFLELYRLTQGSLECTVVRERGGRLMLRLGKPREGRLPESARVYWGDLEWSAGKIRRALMTFRSAGTRFEWRFELLEK